MNQYYFQLLAPMREKLRELEQELRGMAVVPDSYWEVLPQRLQTAGISYPLTSMLTQEIEREVQSGAIHSGAEIYEALRRSITGLLLNTGELRYAQEGAMTAILLIEMRKPQQVSGGDKLAQLLQQEDKQVLLIRTDFSQVLAMKIVQTDNEWREIPVEQQHAVSEILRDVISAPDKHDVVLIEAHIDELKQKRQELEISSVVNTLETTGHINERLLWIYGQGLLASVPAMRRVAEDVGLTGIVLSAIEESIKDRGLFLLLDDLGVPVKMIEYDGRLVPFNAREFVEALF